MASIALQAAAPTATRATQPVRTASSKARCLTIPCRALPISETHERGENQAASQGVLFVTSGGREGFAAAAAAASGSESDREERAVTSASDSVGTTRRGLLVGAMALSAILPLVHPHDPAHAR